MLLPFHSYRLDSQQASTARLINCFAEQAPQQGGKGPLYLRLAPGVELYNFTNATPGRGLHVFGNSVYAVVGNGLVKVDASTRTVIGGATLIPGTDRCFIADNGQQIVITNGAGGYVSNGVNTLVQITDPDFTTRQPGAVDFLGNFLLFVDRGSGRFFASDLADATSYDALNFATAEVAPDNLVTLACSQQEAILLGKTTGERWYLAGGAGFPFARVPGGTFELGCLAEHGVCKIDNTIFWLASDKTIRALRGPTPQRVSQHGVESALQSYERLDDCEAFTYTLQGHTCAVFRFPAAGACWVYDITAGEWHERKSYGSTTWDFMDAAELDGTTYVLNRETGAVGKLTHAVFTEVGNPLRWEATTQGIQSQDNALIPHPWLELLAEVGIGLNSGQGSDPMVNLEVSNDGGRTWFAAPMRSLGAIGNYRTRVRWDRLGSARHRVYRLSGSDPVPFTAWGLSTPAAGNG